MIIKMCFQLRTKLGSPKIIKIKRKWNEVVIKCHYIEEETYNIKMLLKKTHQNYVFPEDSMCITLIEHSKNMYFVAVWCSCILNHTPSASYDITWRGLQFEFLQQIKHHPHESLKDLK